MPNRRQDEPAAARAGERIAKLLARAGIASRREIERMIGEGRVALNGAVIDTPATLLASLAGITVDGNPVAAPAPARLFLYHKPTGLLVTERDPAGRRTIYDRLPSDLPRVVPVGRLDLNTEGLLLLTTDGGFKRQLELPATGVERSYRARAYGAVTQAQLEDLMDGIEIEGIRYGSIDANIERRTGANVWIELTLTEGKNREVRRVLEHLDLKVSRLIRTRYGPFVLGDLPVGEVGEVKPQDLVAFRRTLKGGSPDEPVGLPAVEMPRPGFRTPATADRAVRTRARPAAAAPKPPARLAKAKRDSERPTPSRTRHASERPDAAPTAPRAAKGEGDRPARQGRTRSAPPAERASRSEAKPAGRTSRPQAAEGKRPPRSAQAPRAGGASPSSAPPSSRPSRPGARPSSAPRRPPPRGKR